MRIRVSKLALIVLQGSLGLIVIAKAALPGIRTGAGEGISQDRTA